MLQVGCLHRGGEATISYGKEWFFIDKTTEYVKVLMDGFGSSVSTVKVIWDCNTQSNLCKGGCTTITAAPSTVAPVNCPWMTTTSADNSLECNDGTLCNMASSGESCCNAHGGRKRCPPNLPHMCARANAAANGQDYTCQTDCTNYDGQRPCGTTTRFMSRLQASGNRLQNMMQVVNEKEHEAEKLAEERLDEPFTDHGRLTQNVDDELNVQNNMLVEQAPTTSKGKLFARNSGS